MGSNASPGLLNPPVLDAELPNAQLYEQDFVAWSESTAQLLRDRRFDEVGLEALIEEVSSLGIGQRHALASRLVVLIKHLLKWRYQPEKRKGGWEASIIEQRRRIARLLRTSPSLGALLEQECLDAYPDARREALAETGLHGSVIPEQPAFSVGQLLDESFLPE
ncbi:MAG: DUF29 domain-containing protein [Acidobacteria bacterium]|nr:DUF29 domain-containing protein [Acidobacteriota bacterium]